MARIFIDGKAYEIGDGKNLLEAALSLGLDLPYFCWHPALGSVGACRQCAVKRYRDENDEQGTIVMACMQAADDGARLSIADPEAREFRASVIEWLMLNHPHDCPICDEGGECHLQDMTVMTGHTYRRSRFPKVTFRNQYLGPCINHEMNRCIECYRCVRFYREYAGGRDLDVFGAHDRVYFGRHQDGVLESEFSGNLVEVCPTGVFTDKTLKAHYTRKWDLTSAPSVCVHCGVGCNTFAAERYGRLARILNRYHREVNGHFLCDRGRFGYEFANSTRRLRRAWVRGASGGMDESGGDNALHAARDALGGGRVIGIGSPRASLEANFALRALVGAESFFDGMGPAERELARAAVEILEARSVAPASPGDTEGCDAVFVLGEDVPATAPRLGLSLRQAARNEPLREADRLGIPPWHDAARREVAQDRTGPFFVATALPTRLDDIARDLFRGPPVEVARLGYAVAHALDASMASPGDLPAGTRELAGRIAVALRDARRPVVVSGPGAGSVEVLDAAAAVARALDRARGDGSPSGLCLTSLECDTVGSVLLGGRGLAEAFEEARSGRVDAVVVLENDLYRRAPASEVDAFLDAAGPAVVLDHLCHATVERAAVALPAAPFAEGDGTLVNHEGRAQRHYQVFVPEAPIRESWRWLRDLHHARSRRPSEGTADPGRWDALDDVVADLCREIPRLEAVRETAPPASFRAPGGAVPRQSHRYSGRTAMNAHRSVHEPRPPSDLDSPLAFSMEGTRRPPPPPLLARYWSPGWNSVQALTRFQEEVEGPLRGEAPGPRVLGPGEGEGRSIPARPPAPFARREAEWLLLPVWQVFGSEELSARAPAIAERTPPLRLLFHPDDAAGLGLAAGDAATVRIEQATARLAVEIHDGLHRGTAGLPAGAGPFAGHALPAWGRIARSSGDVARERAEPAAADGPFEGRGR